MAETGLVFKLPVKCSNTGVKMNFAFVNIATPWFSILLIDKAMCRVVFDNSQSNGHTSLTVQIRSCDSLDKEDVPIVAGSLLEGFRSATVSKIDLFCGKCKTCSWRVPDFKPKILTVPFTHTHLLSSEETDEYDGDDEDYHYCSDCSGPCVRIPIPRNDICYSAMHELHVTVTFDVTHEPAENTSTSSILSVLHDGLMSDVTLRVGEKDHKDLKAHRCLLAASSRVFQAMFESGNYVESLQGFVEITDFDAEVVDVVLRTMYGKELQPRNANTLTEVLRFAEKYELTKLKKLCEIKLSHDVSLDALSLLAIADNTNANILAEAVITRIVNSQNRASIVDGESAKALLRSNPDVFLKLFMKLAI